ncbi:hypothetical protein GCM10007978_17190 [Shewanella hanedai]|nr:hypothetical protein GCM10007978_17190 [Shewanella hanedai]
MQKDKNIFYSAFTLKTKQSSTLSKLALSGKIFILLAIKGDHCGATPYQCPNAIEPPSKREGSQ